MKIALSRRFNAVKDRCFGGVFTEKRKDLVCSGRRNGVRIEEESYRARIVSLIDGYLCLYERETGGRLSFLQDGASCPTARGTMQDLRERNVVCIQWPAYSPDLDPIEIA